MKKEKIKKINNEEDFADLKSDVKKEQVKKILGIGLWAILFIWMAFCVTDFILVKTNNKPIFCAFDKVKEYDDGKVTTCYGLGYKVLDYDRQKFSALDFAPLWRKVK